MLKKFKRIYDLKRWVRHMLLVLHYWMGMQRDNPIEWMPSSSIPHFYHRLPKRWNNIFMPQRRGTTTDQLANVIQVIEMGKKTGLLTVEHDHGAKREIGEVTFVRGKIMEAHSGQLNGQQALNLLSTWGACHFAFIPLAKESYTEPQMALPPLQSRQAWKSTLPDLPALTGIAWNEEGERAERLTDSIPVISPNPRRVEPGEATLRLLEQAGLSRLHRHLFQLADGQRSRAELVRLIGHRPDEVQRLLDDLERIGVIQQ